MAMVRSSPSVAVLLSGRERFSPYYGGALARWTYEVYSRLQGQLNTVVLGYPTAKADLYPLPHRTSHAWPFCNLIGLIPRMRRYEDQLWLQALFGQLLPFDAVHIHNRPQWVGFLRRFGYRGLIVLHLQNNHLGHWNSSMLDALAPQLDLLVVCSHFLRCTFAARSPALAAKTKVVFNGVNTTLFHPEESVREPRTIFFVGRFDQEKGVLQLVQAYARVLHEHPQAQLVIGGATGFGVHKETPYVRAVRRLAATLVQEKGAHIQFTGYLHHDRDLPTWFQRATIFASPSLFQEPFGLVNAEAMACATPVVGATRGGIPEVLGATGCLIDPENIDQFAEALCGLLSDSDYRAQLGHAACQRCREMFDWDVIAGQWAGVLADIAMRPRIP
jgi:spore coat protein SA